MAALGGAPAAGPAVAPVVPVAAGDVRTLAVARDAQGHRYRDFPDCVRSTTEDAFDDWPITGPRTLAWVMQFVLENGGSFLGRHTKWRADCRLQATDPGVIAHEKVCRALQVGLAYDQLNGPNIAMMELLARDLQVQEERYRDRLEGQGGQEVQEAHLFYGTQLMRGTVCVSPLLREHIADELRKETAVTKERRKAREERQLLKPTSKKKGGKDKEDDA